ncbi:MAG: ankyrin repeat domain-containing protein [Candidatus Eisenbacteria bacterium]|nr:ankyrin repeat domain-containing protein [Candidatus Eisenbacteria bacterium]
MRKSAMIVLLLTAAIAVSTIPASAGAIHDAVRGGDAARVGELLRADPSLAGALDESDRFQARPLHIAARAGNVEIARMLLDAGAAVDAFDSDESTPLDEAGLHRHMEMVDLLLARGAEVNRRDKNGGDPLSFAASGGDPAIVARLIDAGADLFHRDRGGITLLHYAAARGLHDLVDLLMERGEDPDVAGDIGQTPLHWTAFGRDTTMVERLVAAGADPNASTSEDNTPLLDAVMRDNAPIVRALLRNGADPNMANSWGGTPLHGAARNGRPELVEVLLANGADPDHRTGRGDTPLSAASNEGHIEIVATLLEAGANTETADTTYGYTPLHLAALYGYGDIAEALLSAGAPVNPEDREGRTPLLLASARGNAGAAEILRKAGGRPRDAETERHSLASCPDLGKKEAMIWHLGHSGWVIKTENNLLVFDYWPMGRIADDPGLCNGHIDPDEIAGERVTVFASHEHRDHYDPMIFDWRERVPNITYVLGCRPDSVPPCVFMDGRETRTVNGMKVTTITSNDTGVGFWIEVDGLTILHPGDHANRLRDFSGPYKAEIDWLAEKGVRPDICFAPIRGCGFGDQVAVKMGVHYLLETLEPVVFLPMHGGTAFREYESFIEECRSDFPKTKMEYPTGRGDRFHYKKGSIS